jgi:hypothetical protein
MVSGSRYPHRCRRESAEYSLLSPMTHNRPGGTTMSKGYCDGRAPGAR